ncbi:15510_t:CDS:2, partial [Acaulospora morrowiae]
MHYVYVLECENGKYYVGSTNNMMNRYNEHTSGGDRSATWTRKYLPICIVWVGLTNNSSFELAKTIEYMKIYGKENVRGAHYCQLILDSSVDDDLYDVCFQCGGNFQFGGKYHRAKGCNNCPDCGNLAALIVVHLVM